MTTDVATFFRAIAHADHASIRSQLAANPSLIRATDPTCFGAVPLLRPADSGDRATLDLLLELGADVNQRSDWWAGSFGLLDSCPDEMADYLLARGATLTPHAAARLGKLDQLRTMLATDPALVHARGGDGQTPLHFARTPAIADLLLSHSAVIDALDIDHASTPAQWLATSNPSVVAHLISRGAAPDPFMAARIGDAPLLDRLLPSEPDGVNTRISRSRFPAAPPAAGHIYLYTIGDGCTLAHAAAGADQEAVIRLLAARGADMNARGGYDNATPLHTAAWSNSPRAIIALIECGADLNAPSGHIHNNQPLGWAIVSGAVDACRTLLDRGAKVHAHHVQDARHGAQGAFTQYNRRRPRQAWDDIATLLVSA